MAAYKEKIFVNYALETVMMAAEHTVTEMKWKLLSEDRSKISIREVPLHNNTLALPAQIDMKIQQLSDSVGLEINGSLAGFGGGPTEQIKMDVKDFIERLHKNLDKIGTPEQQAERRIEAQRIAAEQREAAIKATQELEAERRAAEERAEQYRQARQREVEERVVSKRAKPTDAYSDAPVATAAPVAVPVMPVSSGAPSLSEELEKLGRLHQQGILTDDEFKQAKHKLLGL